MAGVFTIAIFLAASLLFVVQPMVAKGLLPILGGAPAVWNTCMVFFQAALLAGYLYSHAITTRLGLKSQLIVHALVLGAAGLALPMLAPGEVPDAEACPTLWLLKALAISAGLPFFAIATSGPLLQRWFSNTAHPRAHDPYFLYAASNAGSLLGLLAYPFIIERVLSLPEQAWAWAGAYTLAAILLLAGGLLAVKNSPKPDKPTPDVSERRRDRAEPIEWPRRLRWVFFAFVPSSLMLGVTHHLTTDVASVPLLWVVPLGLYLLTMILAFSEKVRIPMRWLSAGWALLALCLTLMLLLHAREPIALVTGIHLLGLVGGGLLCHQRLADDRPPPARLTEFYLWLAIGGALGGVFNALVAPVLFSVVLEYPLTIALACFARPLWNAGAPAEGVAGPESTTDRRKRLAGLVLLPLIPALIHLGMTEIASIFVPEESGLTPWLVDGPTALAIALLWRRRTVFAIAITLLLVIAVMPWRTGERVLDLERTFFGVLLTTRETIRVDEGGGVIREVPVHIIKHGTTFHGAQMMAPGYDRVPITYYHPEGPLGDTFRAMHNPDEGRRLSRVGGVGLGAGAAAAYAHAGQRWTFIEIDPAMVRVAQDPRLFTYLRDSHAPVDIIIGDGRIRLAEMPEASFDLLIVDAFSSDSIPMHLITREAIELYLSRVRSRGVVVMHISNRYLDLEPVIGSIAESLGVRALVRADFGPGPGAEDSFHYASTWVALSPEPEGLDELARTIGWFPVEPGGRGSLWTDADSSILPVLRWR
ncbi:MAG: fused MFS/spermidine synthase [Phycisphaerales bacterium]|nr:fused MFS/spermidine synthase [Phycisphaerales bacterium]